jgi:hypothetical protein
MHHGRYQQCGLYPCLLRGPGIDSAPNMVAIDEFVSIIWLRPEVLKTFGSKNAIFQDSDFE